MSNSVGIPVVAPSWLPYWCTHAGRGSWDKLRIGLYTPCFTMGASIGFVLLASPSRSTRATWRLFVRHQCALLAGDNASKKSSTARPQRNESNNIDFSLNRNQSESNFRLEAGVRPAPLAASRNRKGQKGLQLPTGKVWNDNLERTNVLVELWILTYNVASDTHEVVKHTITLENTLHLIGTESNLRRVYLYHIIFI